MKWTDYTTKETLKDNDELMILDKDANANKRTLMDKIWNYVVDKMTTAVITKLETTNKTLIGAVNELNSNKISHTKYAIINPAKGFSLTLDDASTYLICYAGIDVDNIKNICFSAVISRSSSNTKGGILNIKSEIPQSTLSLEENVLKCTTTVWVRIYVIKL